MAGKLVGDKDTQDAAKNFIDAVIAARCKSAVEARAVFDAKRSFRIIGGQVYSVGPQVQKPLRDLLRLSIKRMGPKAGHEKEIESIAWKLASQQSETADKSSVAALLTGIEASGGEPLTYVIPNYAIRFEGSVQELVIGPVKAAVGTQLAIELRGRKDTPNWSISVGLEPGLSFAPDPVITLAPVAWQVELTSAKGNAREEALWLIDMALSLLRLTHSPMQQSPFFPQIGETEAHPTEEPDFQDRDIIYEKDGLTVGGTRSSRMYTIGEAQISHQSATDFQTKVGQVFEHKSGSLGERVARGLGWMTRGRRSLDRSERFLFFFTAIEALLSSSDKTAPVVQTIARHAATILVADPVARAELARAIRQSYETRSALVHGGRRNVSHLEAADAQILTEAIYNSVLQKASLDAPAADFEASLVKASFGLAWPHVAT